MGRKPILGELALVHWDAAEAAEFAAELSVARHAAASSA